MPYGKEDGRGWKGIGGRAHEGKTCREFFNMAWRTELGVSDEDLEWKHPRRHRRQERIRDFSRELLQVVIPPQSVPNETSCTGSQLFVCAAGKRSTVGSLVTCGRTIRAGRRLA